MAPTAPGPARPSTTLTVHVVVPSSLPRGTYVIYVVIHVTALGLRINETTGLAATVDLAKKTIVRPLLYQVGARDGTGTPVGTRRVLSPG